MPFFIHSKAKSNESMLSSNPGSDPDPDVEATAEPSQPIIDTCSNRGEKKVDDPNVVNWDGPDDPSNPRHWSLGKKYNNIFIHQRVIVSHTCGLCDVRPRSPQIDGRIPFYKPTTRYSRCIDLRPRICLWPIASSSIIEINGRLWIYHITNVLFLIITIACAVSDNFGMLIAFRFLAGVAGSCPLANGGGTLSDLIIQEKRGAAMVIFGLGPLLGPVIGPVIGGYLAGAKGWRWVFWLIAICMGVLTISMFLFADETYGKVLLERKAAKLRLERKNPEIKSKLSDNLSNKQVLKRALIRPQKLLIFSPIVLALSIFQGLCFGCLYLLFTTFSRVFTEVYHWHTSTDGLSFLGLGVGMFLGLVIFGFISDKILKSKAGEGELKPEYRLLPMIPATIFISAGLFWYGWSIQAQNHWIIPILGTVLVGFGYIPIILATQMYLVDAFEEFSASALATSIVLRSTMGAILPLAGTKMYGTLGYGWGNSLLAFITLGMLPFPWLFYTHGERLRKVYTTKL